MDQEKQPENQEEMTLENNAQEAENQAEENTENVVETQENSHEEPQVDDALEEENEITAEVGALSETVKNLESSDQSQDPEDPEDTNDSDKVKPKLIQDEMRKAYINYAMAVIVGRALPDVRDGLKPVHRRILYAMNDMGMFYNRPFKKCARIVGEVLGKYHPHGDSAVYDSLVRMAQEFSLRYPLIKGQGNFGSIDGDNAAAMRYCITGDSLIPTNKGILLIKEISDKTETKINTKILSYNGKQNTASKFFNSGKHEIIQVVTEQDYEIKGSFNHPLLCWKLNEFGMPSLQWKMLSEIKKDDYVLINRKFSLFNKNNLNIMKYSPKFSAKEKKISLPKTMNKSLAFLLGALVAEGGFHQKKIIFNNKDIDYYNKVKKCIFENFPEVKLYERDIKGNCKELDLYPQSVVRFLINLGLKEVKSDLKEIPSSILLSKREIIKEFLVALFEGDGSVQFITDKRHGGKSIQLYYDSKSKKLAQQLKILLLNFGIITASFYKDKRNGCYRLIIPGTENIKIFRKRIGFFSKKKKDVLSKIKIMNKSRMSKIDNIPFLNSYLRSNYSGQFIKKNNFDRYNNLEKNYSKLTKALRTSDKKLISWLLKHKYFFNKVKTVEKLPKKETVYSVKVDSSCHSFIANGFVNHNTEAKLNQLAGELLKDIDKETVDFRENFDGSLKEPTVLPSALPNLLINGSSGIAVGMATNIPPHNVSEVCDAVIATVDNPEITIPELMKIVPAPDFPTGGEVYVGGELLAGYTRGRGRVMIKSVVEIEEEAGKIIIKEIPYMVNKADLIIQIAELVKDKRVQGIRNINDESDREGIRVVIDLKRDIDPQIVLNQLFKHSRLRVSFSLNMLALVDNQPKLLGLKDFLLNHISHRKEVVTRRTQFELRKAEERLHILEGLLIALNNLDEVIPGIRNSSTVEEAKEFLMDNYLLSEIQAKAILDMKLQKLASLEREKIKNEHHDLTLSAERLREILASEEMVYNIIKEETLELRNKYGDERRSQVITGDMNDVDMEDLIEETTQVVTMTNSGYLKRVPLETYRTQHRGGKGVLATGMKDDDFIENVYVTSTHAHLLFFTDQGQVYWLKVYHIPEGSRQSRGRHVANLTELREGENITAVVSVRDFEEDSCLFMATEKGIVKKTKLKYFSKPRKGGIRAISLPEEDSLIGVQSVVPGQEIILVTRKGLANRFKESKVRDMGRTAYGVRGIRLNSGDEVVSLLIAEPGKLLLTLTMKGYGKRTPVNDYRLCNRGGKGVTNLKVTAKNGKVVTAKIVDGSEDLMLISRNGVGIRVKSKSISVIGRATQGVRVMRLGAEDQLAAAAKIISEDEDVVEGAEDGPKEKYSVDEGPKAQEEQDANDDQEDLEEDQDDEDLEEETEQEQEESEEPEEDLDEEDPENNQQ